MSLPQNFSTGQTIFFYSLYFWALFWKGLALWKASKSKQRNWFIVILILNTVGILEIVYLFCFAKTRMHLTEIKEGFKKIFYTKSEK
ncbi:MAG TPA: DUF5652 family protein [Candidatus Limnocylindrales bacterium]|nr:DUF5652 family protein [Candidatus Limnocylindrales bacterium]